MNLKIRIVLILGLLGFMLFTFKCEGNSSFITQDVNSWLTSAYRCDLVGPEVWTGPLENEMTKGKIEYWNENIPFSAFGIPSPGMNGQLHVVHQVTNSINSITIELEEECKTKVEFIPIRHQWTPAFSTTYYRAMPTRISPEEIKDIGRIVLKETKAILSDNTFLSEATIKNASATTLTCRVSVKTNSNLPEAGSSAKEWRFATRSMERVRERVTFVACKASFPGSQRIFEIPARSEVTFRYALSFSPDSISDAAKRAKCAIENKDAFAANVQAFNGWFAKNVPVLETGNPDLMRMYLYRWFIIKRGTHEARRVIQEHEYPRYAVYESPVGGWYNCVIGLPVPLQIQELAWQRDPEVLHSHILNWCDNVAGYRLYIQFTAQAIARSFENHPSTDFAKKVLGEVVKYAKKTAGKNPDKLPVQAGSWLTGAEYQPNFYQFTDPPWDFRNDEAFVYKDKRFRHAKLVRLDRASYDIGNLLGASKIADMAGEASLAQELRDFAASRLNIIRNRHWSEELGLFLAADPETYKLADKAACYDSFTPYMWGLIDDYKYLRAFDKLIDRNWFWDDFPISSCAKTCPMYCGENLIITSPASPQKPYLYGCNWNGPTWHYSNSLIAEAFGQAAQRRVELRNKWVEFFNAWNEMHWLYGDRTAPRAAESVRPEDGAKCNSAWDYLHSSWIDPFFRYFAGVQVVKGKTIRFEPFSKENFRLSNVPLLGREFTFEQKVKDGICNLTIRDREGNSLASGTTALLLEVPPSTISGD